MRKRIIFDIALTVILVFEMLYQVTGNAAHELVGAAFFACIVAHLAFNAKWIGAASKSLASRTLAKRTRMLLVVACLLALDMVLLIFSSLVISETLWNAGVDLSTLNPGNIWYPIHVGSSYALCILVLLHLSLHWTSVAETLKIQYDPARREAIGSGVNALLAIGGIALGITGILRTSFEASDFVVSTDEESQEDGKTVTSGYRERNAQTGELVENAVNVEVYSESGTSSQGSSSSDASTTDVALCPICPRQCKLTAPRCERPYEQGLIS